MAMTSERGCDLCDGRGWRVVETDDGSHAERCACWRAREGDRRLSRAGIPEGLRHCHLADFVNLHPVQRMARAAAQEFVDTWPLTGASGLLFHGPAGTGKTHLVVAIVRELVAAKGARALFLDFRGLLKTIQESWNPISETSEKEVLERVLSADLLALDDLGAEKPSPWVRETVAYVINERYIRGKPVLITTNLRYAPPEARRESARLEIARRVGRESAGLVDSLEDRLGVPTLSRLYEMCKPVDMGELPDFRKTVKIFGTDRDYRRE